MACCALEQLYLAEPARFFQSILTDYPFNRGFREDVAAMQLLALQKGKKPRQLPTWIKARKNYHEIKIE